MDYRIPIDLFFFFLTPTLHTQLTFLLLRETSASSILEVSFRVFLTKILLPFYAP